MGISRAYYNEFDPKAAAWLRNLIKNGHLAPGDVDERSITEVVAADLKSYTQCHFFAGIGGWSYALRLAGWPDDRPVWTGSCPCQPFSAAGKRGGTDDARHLWPEFHRLISECRPATVFGEQVASKDGLAWLDIVSADLESADYAIGAADLCAAGVEAPHLRQRLWFVAHSNGSDASAERQQHGGQQRLESAHGGAMQLAVAEVEQHDGRRDTGYGRREPSDRGGMVQPDSAGRPTRSEATEADGYWGSAIAAGSWVGRCDWIECLDGKWRPIEPGTFPLAHGVPARMGRLRGYGNAIVPQVAAEFIEAYLEL